MTSTASRPWSYVEHPRLAASELECLQDEIEAPLELERVVVAGLGDVRGDLDQVRVLAEVGDGLRFPLHELAVLLRGIERQSLLLQSETVDIAVLDRVRVHGQLE